MQYLDGRGERGENEPLPTQQESKCEVFFPSPPRKKPDPFPFPSSPLRKGKRNQEQRGKATKRTAHLASTACRSSIPDRLPTDDPRPTTQRPVLDYQYRTYGLELAHNSRCCVNRMGESVCLLACLLATSPTHRAPDPPPSPRPGHVTPRRYGTVRYRLLDRTGSVA